MSTRNRLSISLTHICRSAPDDIPSPERIRSLLKDLREVRQGKAREGLEHLNPVELNVRSSSGCLIQASPLTTPGNPR